MGRMFEYPGCGSASCDESQCAFSSQDRHIEYMQQLCVRRWTSQWRLSLLSSAPRVPSTAFQERAHDRHIRNGTKVFCYELNEMSHLVDNNHCLIVAIRAAAEAGACIRKAWSESRTVHHKGAIDLVTETDRECEKLIGDILKREFPEHCFIGEEETAALGHVPELTNAPTWLVDPVDGTTNFVHGFPFCCVSIALAINSKVVVGVVYNPVLDELFHAVDGQGAYLNNTKISCSDASDMQSSIFITELGTRRDEAFLDAAFSRIRAMAAETRGLRSCGSCALNLCSVACGRADAYFEIGLGGPWDMAAGAKILEEAGGVACDPAGGPLDIMSRRVLGTNAMLKDKCTSILSGQPLAPEEPQPTS